MKNKKGNLWNLVPAALAFVVIGVLFTVGQDILGDLGDDYSANTYEKNASTNSQKGIQKITNWLPLIGLILAAGIIIQILMGSLAARKT